MRHAGIYIIGATGVGRDEVARAIKARFLVLDSTMNITIKKANDLINNDLDSSLSPLQKMRLIRDSRETLKCLYGADYWNNKLLSTNGTFPIISDGSGMNNLDYWRGKNFCCVGVFAKEAVRIPQIEVEYGFSPILEDLRHKTELESIYSATSLTDYSLEYVDTLQNLATKARQLATTIFNLAPETTPITEIEKEKEVKEKE